MTLKIALSRQRAELYKNERYFARLLFLYMSKERWNREKCSVTPSKFICPVCGMKKWWLGLESMEVHRGTSVYMIRLSHKKEWNNTIWSNTDDLEIIILSDVSKKKKDKYHVLIHLCRIWKKKGTDDLICKAEIETQI